MLRRSFHGRISVAAGLALIAAVPLTAQHSYSPADIENGIRLYRTHCISCHGSDGDAIPGIDLQRGQFRRGSADEDLTRLITKGVPGTAMPPTELAPPQLFSLIAYIRSMREFQSRSGPAGDAKRGQALFEGKGGCLSCHRVKGNGSRLGPDLTEIGLIRPPTHLERSILAPSESILPQHRFMRAVRRDGAEITGRRLNEDTHTIQLLDSKERLISLLKADLRDYAPLRTSPMPSFDRKVSPQELADLVSYLLSLRGDTQ